MAGAFALWAVSACLGAFYQTMPGNPMGRINDFLVEAMPSVRQLAAGHITGFFATAPAYVGSMIGRAPFALAAVALHGSWETIYVVSAVPCLIAAPILSIWLAKRVGTISADSDAPHVAARRRWLVLSPLGILLALNPILIKCLIMGHPEDVLGAVLAIAGVIQAARQRASWSMLLLGLAVANKSWALVAFPVGLALLDRIPLRSIALFLLTVMAADVPYFLAQHPSAGGALGSGVGTIFLPLQWLWWFGPTFWVSVHAHQIIVVAAFILAGLWRVNRGRQLSSGRSRLHEGLLLLALIFLLRAALDPWDNVYYQLPFLMTVYALENGRAPRISALLTLVMVAVCVPLHYGTSGLHALAYALATLPMAGYLLLRVELAPARWDALVTAVTAERGARADSGPVAVSAS